MIHNVVALAIVLGTLCMAPLKAEDASQVKETVSVQDVVQAPQDESAVNAKDDNSKQTVADTKQVVKKDEKEDVRAIDEVNHSQSNVISADSIDHAGEKVSTERDYAFNLEEDDFDDEFND
jgi:hypothetical protein